MNCAVNSWSSWGSCNAACEKNGNRARTRTVKTQSSCNGTPCPTLTETKPCRGPCCPRDCQVSTIMHTCSLLLRWCSATCQVNIFAELHKRREFASSGEQNSCKQCIDTNSMSRFKMPKTLAVGPFYVNYRARVAFILSSTY